MTCTWATDGEQYHFARSNKLLRNVSELPEILRGGREGRPGCNARTCPGEKHARKKESTHVKGKVDKSSNYGSDGSRGGAKNGGNRNAAKKKGKATMGTGIEFRKWKWS